MRPRTSPRTFAAITAAVVLVVASCTAYQAGWTFDPTIGQATGGPPAAPSGATESGAASSAAAGPSPSVAAGLPSPSAGAGGSPGAGAGAVIQVTAKNISFDQHSLTVAANVPFTIQFSNQDIGIPHNIAIYTDSTKSNNLFRGTILTGPGQTSYSVQALPAGTYYFQCDVHPAQMNGTITVH